MEQGLKLQERTRQTHESFKEALFTALKILRQEKTIKYWQKTV